MTDDIPPRDGRHQLNAAPRLEDGDEAISFLDLAAVLLRQRWTVLIFMVVSVLVVVVLALTSARTWSASASFMPQAATEGTQTRLADLAGQFGVNVPAGESGQSPQFYADLVRSREILGAIATDTFSVSDTTGLFASGNLEGPVFDLLQLDLEGSPPRRRAAAIDWLREQAVSVSTGTETGLVEVTVTTPWPELSGMIAGRVLSLVNDFNLRTRQTQAAAEREFISSRLSEAQRDLRQAENALQTFLQNNRQFQNSPELVFEHDRLQRQVAMRQEVYTSLMQSLEEARIAEVRNTPVITVVERAEVPVRPDSRRLLLRAALGLMLGGFLGASVGFGREYIRRQREDGDDDFQEFAVVWEETKADVRRVLPRLRQ